jgi:hypothetical protein
MNEGVEFKYQDLSTKCTVNVENEEMLSKKPGANSDNETDLRHNG